MEKVVDIKKRAVSRIYPMQVLPSLLMIIPLILLKIKSFSALCDNFETFKTSRPLKLVL